MLDTIVNILILVGIISVIVFVHELGHYLLARKHDVQIDEFAIGMGPVVYQWVRGETKYSIRALPIGGFVSMLGEEESDDAKVRKLSRTSKRSFLNKTWWQKISILFAGVFFNFLFASVIYYGVIISLDGELGLSYEVGERGLPFGTVEKVQYGDVSYSSLAEGEPAQEAGWPEKGVVTAIDGEEIIFTEDFKYKVKTLNSDEYNEFTVCDVKDGERKNELVAGDNCNIYVMSVSEDSTAGIYINVNYYYQVVYEGVDMWFSGFEHSLNTMHMFVTTISGVFAEANESGDYSNAVNSVGGPVAMYYMVDFVRSDGVMGLVVLTAGLNITLFIMNIMPIPALDGGRIILVAVRSVLGDRFSHKLEAWMIGVTYIGMLALMLALLIKDIVFVDEFRKILESM